MTILSQVMKIINKEFIPNVPRKHFHQFVFGVKALTLSRFQSLNSNARIILENRSTAESKIYRLTKNEKILRSFYRILKHLDLIDEQSIVIIDFSTFCGFQVLTLALQTKEGRAIPLFFDVITYPIREATSQNLFIIETIKRFKEIIGFYPQFVLDRGFAIPSLVQFFIKNNIFFYVRSKMGKNVLIPDKEGKERSVPLSQIKPFDSNVLAYGFSLRLIISNKSKKSKEPWYIFTNNFDLKRKEIIEIYYYRFEIEETFKDLKYLFELNQLTIKKKLTFKILLWFFILAIWTIYLLKERLKYTLEQVKTNTHKKLSHIRYYFESIQRSIFNSAFNLHYRNAVF
jgi:hypothetical protein